MGQSRSDVSENLSTVLQGPEDVPSRRLSRFHFSVILAMMDFAGLAVSFFIPWWFRVGIYSQTVSAGYMTAFALSIGVFFLLAFSDGVYREQNLARTFEALYRAGKTVFLMFGVLLVIAFLWKTTADFSRIWGGAWFSCLGLYMLLSRTIVIRAIKQRQVQGELINTALVVGTSDMVSRVVRDMTGNAKSEVSVTATIEVSPVATRKELASLAHAIKRLKVDDVIIAVPSGSAELLNRLAGIASETAVNIYLAPDTIGTKIGNGKLHTIGNTAYIEIDTKPIQKWHALIKRLEDIILASLMLLFAWPIMLLTALAIKLESKGPLLFVQPRYGFNNELIDVYKFRSMYADMTDKHASKQTCKNDPRVTRVGRFIRRTSIDELPQLLNVLKGEMSLVGPRPHAAETKAAGKLFEEVVEQYAVRHRVKPGLTGWAQVNGWRGETDTEDKLKKRVECDLYYIRNWNIWLDFFILLKTAYVVLFEKEAAY